MTAILEQGLGTKTCRAVSAHDHGELVRGLSQAGSSSCAMPWVRFVLTGHVACSCPADVHRDECWCTVAQALHVIWCAFLRGACHEVHCSPGEFEWGPLLTSGLGYGFAFCISDKRYSAGRLLDLSFCADGHGACCMPCRPPSGRRVGERFLSISPTPSLHLCLLCGRFLSTPHLLSCCLAYGYGIQGQRVGTGCQVAIERKPAERWFDSRSSDCRGCNIIEAITCPRLEDRLLTLGYGSAHTPLERGSSRWVPASFDAVSGILEGKCRNCGQFCQGGGFCKWIESQIEVFVRSFLLLYLLSASKAFWYATPLMKGDRPSNAVVRDGRSIFRGAPLLLFFAVGCTFASATGNTKMTHADSSGSVIRRPYGTADVASLHRPGEDAHEDSGPGGCSIVSRDVAGYISLLILRFQHHDMWSRVPYWDGVDSVWAYCRALEAVADTGKDLQVILVDPQPAFGAVVFVAVSHGPGILGRIPVCFHILRIPHVPFVEFLDSTSSLSDVRHVLGQNFRLGDNVFVGDALHPLDDDESFRTRPGILIRVIPGVQRARPLRSLEFKLDRPDLRLGQAVPIDAAVTDGRGTAFVLVAAQEDRTIPLRRDLTPAGIRACIAGSFAHVMCGFDAVPVGGEICSVAIAGRPAACGFAVFPRSRAPLIPIVVDGRAVGFGLKLVIIDPGRCSLGQLLSRCGIPDVADFPWKVTGAAYFDAAARAFFLRRADCIILGMKVGSCSATVSEDAEVHRALRFRRKLDLEEQLLASLFFRAGRSSQQ